MTKASRKRVRVAIVGSRGFPKLDLVRNYVAGYEDWSPQPVIVSGGAPGVDSVAEMVAKRVGLKTRIILPNWNKYGKGAGFRRNAEILANADRVVAFWDGLSKGTLHTIQLAAELGMPIKVFIRPHKPGKS